MIADLETFNGGLMRETGTLCGGESQTVRLKEGSIGLSCANIASP